MKKFFLQMLIGLMLGGPLVSFGSAVSLADSVTESTGSSIEVVVNSDLMEDIDSSNIEPIISSEETVDTTTEMSSESVSEENSEVTAESSSDEQVVETEQEITESTEESVKQTELTVTFQTDRDSPFANGETSIELSKKVGENLSEKDIPELEQSDKFIGWILNEEKLSNEELVSLDLNEDIVLQANIEKANRFTALADSYADTSVNSIVSGANYYQVMVIPSPIDDASYAAYSADETGVRQALFDMYEADTNQEYVLFMGTSVGMNIPSTMTGKVIPETVSPSNITFYALKDRVSRLIITSSLEDPINDSVGIAAYSSTITFSGNVHFGTDVVIRNLVYSSTVTNIYMNGHNLNLNGGSYGNSSWNIYGGSDSGDLTGSPTITVNATGPLPFSLYGGNQSGGTLTGNPSIVVNNTTTYMTTITAGSNRGTIDGDTSVTINRLNGWLTNLYGGGVGSGIDPNSEMAANVTGNVTTNVQTTNANFQLGTTYGGVLCGNIGGQVHTKIFGTGGWYLNPGFVGGSGYGNIGSDRTVDAVTTNIDSSNYSIGGVASFQGGNSNTGTITGNIKNTVKSGKTTSTGGINQFDGGTSSPYSLPAGAINLTTFDEMTPDERKDVVEKLATFKVYGNITSHLVSGLFGSNYDYTTAAGRSGFIEGNTSIEVGTLNEDGSTGGDGLAYRLSGPGLNLDYSSAPDMKARGYSAAWDIVGGGGSPNRVFDIYIKGDTKTVINNAVARWTYGGSFSGVIEGNSSNTLNGGIVDTLEGAGFNGIRIYGNANTTVNNGQVDWFLSGGGWDDSLITGNVGVTVYEGMINASMGASYGASSVHTIAGNSDNRIYGGDFSGTSRENTNGFSGGITLYGNLLGDASLTIDLREYDGTFSLPGGTSISGGRPFNTTSSYLGTDTDNTITLNILTKPGTDVLNGATIYGDGGANSALTRSGNIFVNIQAPDSSIGNLYLTNYGNTEGGRILRNGEIKVESATSINGLSGGNAADDFNNTVVANSDNRVEMSFGEDIDGTGIFQEGPINIDGVGVVNFTDLNVTNGVKLLANTGDIKNGRLSAVGTHATQYNEFGDIHLSKDAGIGVSASNMISAAKLTVEDAGTIQSPPGEGKAIFTDFETPDLIKDSLTWLKTTTDDSGALVASEAETFGSVSAYQVLTINPTIENAKAVTPENFFGYEEATGKFFIGDSDTSKSGSGYGIAIPGSKIEYEVEAPIAEAIGSITHDVTAVKEGNEPLTVGAWGTDLAGVEVQKGTLLIPYTAENVPTLSFIPETEDTGSWLYSAVIETSKVNAEAQTIEEQENSDVVEWTSPDGEYNYTIKVKYSNEAELTAKNIIIPEQKAANLTKEEALEAINAVGRPFFKDSITDEELANIQQALADDVYRKHPVSLEVGTSADNQLLEIVNLVVVNDESTIAEDGTFAVYAKAARMTLEEANALADEESLAKYTAATTIFADSRENVLPTVNQTAFDAIQQATEAELVKNVATAYSYQESELTAEKIINVMIAGELKLVSAPTDFDFGEQIISTSTQTYWPTITGDLVVKDTRGPERSTWRLTVREEQVLTDGENTLDNTLSFEKDGQEQFLNGGDAIVEETQLSDNNDYVVSQNWGATQETGLKLIVPVEKQRVGDYSGTLSWQFADVPGNP